MTLRAALLPSRCNFLLITKAQSGQTGQMDGDATPAPVLANVPCRLDVNKSARDVTGTAEYERATHIIFINPVAITLNTKLHQAQVDGITYRLMEINPVYGRESTPHHVEILVLRVG